MIRHNKIKHIKNKNESLEYLFIVWILSIRVLFRNLKKTQEIEISKKNYQVSGTFRYTPWHKIMIKIFYHEEI